MRRQARRSNVPRRSAPPRARGGPPHAVAALVLLFAAPGCGRHDTVLARIGTRTITREDFEIAAAASAVSTRTRPQRARARLLDDLVKRELLLRLADERGLTHNPSHRAITAAASRSRCCRMP